MASPAVGSGSELAWTIFNWPQASPLSSTELGWEQPWGWVKHGRRQIRTRGRIVVLGSSAGLHPATETPADPHRHGSGPDRRQTGLAWDQPWPCSRLSH